MAARDLAIVVYSPFPHASGGRETWLAHMLPALAAAGYRTTVYTRAATGPVFHDLSSASGLRLRPLPGSPIGPPLIRRALLNVPVAVDIARFVRQVERALRSDGFGGGLVLGLGAIIDVTPGLRVRRRHPNTKVACVVHGFAAAELGHSFPWARPLLGRLERRSLRACDAVIANGEDTRAWLGTIGVEAAVVPNGVDVAAFERPIAPPAPLVEARQRGEAVLTMVATLRDIKGVRPFIRSLPALRRTYGPRFRAVFVGKGDAERYRRYARRLGVEEHVRFVGEQRDVAAWLQGSDIAVNLSGGAGVAIAAVEALAAGAPVVAWETAVYRQIVEPERTGVLVPDGDSEALAQAFERLLRDAGLRRRLAEAGRAEARRFDWSAAAAKLIEQIARLQ